MRAPADAGGAAAQPVTWSPPLSCKLLPTALADSFDDMPTGWTGLPLAPHPGAFGAARRHHVHEGVDLYCSQGTQVVAVEPGRVVAIEDFTGSRADPPSPWWFDTQAVLVEGASGTVLYGELGPDRGLAVGDVLERGAPVGKVTRVLRTDKGRPRDMLHLELHAHGTLRSCPWNAGGPRPAGLRDPTPLLMEAAARSWDPPGRPAFLKLGGSLVPLCAVEEIQLDDIEGGTVKVVHSGGRIGHAHGFDAVEAVMLTRPSALEGRRLRWRRGAWAVHNMLAHPAMQVMAWCGHGRLGVRLHDATTPVPRG